MADGPSAEDAATDLGDGDFRVTRERHKRQDVSSSTTNTTVTATITTTATTTMTSLSTGQDAVRRVHEDASTIESHYHHHHNHHRYPPYRNCHAHPHLHRRHRVAENHRHLHYRDNRQDERISKEGGAGCADAPSTVASSATSLTNGDDDYDVDEELDEEEEDEDDEEEEEEVMVEVAEEKEEEEEEEIDEDEDEDNDEEEVEDEEEEEEEEVVEVNSVDVLEEYRAGVRIEVTSSCLGDDESSSSNASGADGAAMTGNSNSNNTLVTMRCEDAASSADGRRSRPSVQVLLDTNTLGNRVTKVNDRENDDVVLNADGNDGAAKVCLNARASELAEKDDAVGGKTDDGTVSGGAAAAADGASAVSIGVASVDVMLAVAVPGAAAVAASTATGAVAATAVTTNGLVTARHQGSPFKGQVRMAEDTLVGPCGKKRCADRYDSSESSDSGVAVSCGDCSSSGTSDITEPGSPCSTSSDEGVAIRGASASPLPSLLKLAPSSQISTRPQWPWTPPLAATACSTYKRLKGEPEAGALPRSGAADPTSRGTTKANGKANIGHHHHESQGKITEYFKTQIKPQQPKIKKTSSETMSVLVAKSSTEFRRPPTVQRNKGGLAKYLGTVSPNSRDTSTNDWEVRTLTMSPPPTKKPPPVIVPRTNGKMDKKLPKPVPSLPISNDVLKNIPGCKISSLRLTTTESSGNTKNNSATTAPMPTLPSESMTLDFTGCILSKTHVNENNNLTNGCGSILGSLRSQANQDPFSRLTPPENVKTKETDVTPADEDDVEEEEEDSRSSESKAPLSPILSAPTTIRFPAREPEKDRQQATDSGICRWDKCGANFESSGGLLEHLQVAHINTQTGGDNFVCQWQGCKVQGRSSCSRRWLERHVLSHGGNKPFRCIVDGCGSRFSSQTALERHVNGHFNQPETNSSSGRRSCENGGKLVRRNGKRLRYRRQPWSARLFDYFDSGVMEGLQHRLLELAKSRTQGRLAETPGNSMALTSQVLARRVELDGKTKVLLRWYPQDIEPDEWVLESEVQSTKHVGIRKVAAANPEVVSLALYPAISGGTPPIARAKQRRKPIKNS